MTRTLVFPSSTPDGRAYAEAAKERGEQIVAASSLLHDETAVHFEHWLHLPSVYDAEFAERLADVLSEHAIDRIFSPVSAAYWGISRLIGSGRIQTVLVGEMPILRHVRQHSELMALAAEHLASIRTISAGCSTLTVIEVAAVLNKTMSFFGESHEAKIAAMLAIFSDAPRGDVVEIGVLTGRSASALEMMAGRYDTGAVLAVDPWSHAESVQKESPSELQAMVDLWDARVPFETFLIQLLPLARRQQFNYLPMTSSAAYDVWSKQSEIRSPEFGTTRYGGEIAVLHIDGNHDYGAVKQDVDLWLPHLVPGGWLILDDYLWLHGDGPRRVGNALLSERADIARSFVTSGALFVKLADA